jgi:hypothetical protein
MLAWVVMTWVMMTRDRGCYEEPEERYNSSQLLTFMLVYWTESAHPFHKMVDPESGIALIRP